MQKKQKNPLKPDQKKLILEKNPLLTGHSGENLRILLHMFGQNKAINLIKSG